MKIKKEVLLNFLKITAMTGVSALGSCILDFTKAGIMINSTSASRGMFINALLKKDYIEDYKNIGQIAVQNLQDIVKLLEGFNNNNLQIIIDKNILMITSKKRKVKILLMDIDIIKEEKEFPNKFIQGMEIKIDISILKNFMKNIGIVDSAELEIKVKNKALILKTKGYNEVLELVDTEKNIEKEFSLIFNRVLPDAIANLSGEIMLFLKDNNPIGVVLKAEEVEIKMVIAPVAKVEE